MPNHDAAQNNMLGTRPIKSMIWMFAIPGIISSLVNAAHNIVDQIFVGWGIGDLGIAATNIAFPLSILTTALAALFGMGGASRFNLAMGRGEEEKARKALGNSLFCLVLLGVLLSAAAVLFLHPMLYAFGVTAPILPYAEPYTLIISLGMPFGIVATGTAHFIRSDGNPNYSSLVLLSGAIFNIVFDPIFLFVFDMGMTGIALATALGQLLSCILAVYYLTRKFKTVTLRKSDLLPSGETIAGVCALGAASGFTHLASAGVQIVQSNMLRYYGALSIYGSEVPLAAAGAVGKIMIVLMSCVIGISLGCQPLYGYNYGAKQYDRVRETYLLAIRYGTIISVIAFLCIQLFPRQLLGIFGSDDPMFYTFAVKYMRIFLFMQFVNAFQPITSMFFTSIGKAIVGVWMALIRQVLLLIPLLLLLPYFLGIEGLYWAGPLADGVAATVVIILATREMRSLQRLQQAQQKDVLP